MVANRHTNWTPRTESTIRWLNKKRDILSSKMADKTLGLNWVSEGGEMINLGPVSADWCFSFQLSMSRENVIVDKTDAAADFTLTDDTAIPLQAYQIVHQLLLCGFSISHAVSGRSNRLHILIGLPYKLLVEEAELMKVGMRLLNTKGICPFRRELIPCFPKHAYKADRPSTRSTQEAVAGAHSTCFSSAHRQGLTMMRMKRAAKIHPEVLTQGKKKGALLDSIRQKLKTRSEGIRSYNMYRVLRSFGLYRDFAEVLFGRELVDVARRIKDNMYEKIKPPSRHDRRKKQIQDPRWNGGKGELLQWEVSEMPSVVRVSAWDEDTGSADDKIGSGSIDLDGDAGSKLSAGGDLDVWCNIVDSRGKAAGCSSRGAVL